MGNFKRNIENFLFFFIKKGYLAALVFAINIAGGRILRAKIMFDVSGRFIGG